MSTLPTKITQEDFDYHIRPCLSTAKRGYVSRIPLFKVFNYILYRLHLPKGRPAVSGTSCRLQLILRIQKKARSAIMAFITTPFITTFASGVLGALWAGGAWKWCGN